MKKKVLITTLYCTGGVSSMTELVADYLLEKKYDVSIAYYMPFKINPTLSVPIYQVFHKKPRIKLARGYRNLPVFQIGVYLPELEWARYWLSKEWKSVIEQFDYHIIVSGNILPAWPVAKLGKKCLAQIGSPYLEDKIDKAKKYPWYRRLIDLLFDTPICLIIEKKLLKTVPVLAVSNYTQNRLKTIESSTKTAVFPMSINTKIFYPHKQLTKTVKTIGFIGRLNDPRKNVFFLVDSLKLCRQNGLNLKLCLAGATETVSIKNYAKNLGVEKFVKVTGNITNEKLLNFYHKLDLFIIPSKQEGLCIAGLEAMASGLPVISTRCGGTKEYIKENINGLFVDFSANEMAKAIKKVSKDQRLYETMRSEAVKTVKKDFNNLKIKNIFWQAFRKYL